MAASARLAPARDQESYRVEPHSWQTTLWARVVRRIGRHWVISRHVQRYCRPFRVEGRDRLRGVRGPALIIVNHTSHFDTVVALHVLPENIRSKTTIAAAAAEAVDTNKGLVVVVVAAGAIALWLVTLAIRNLRKPPH